MTPDSANDQEAGGVATADECIRFALSQEISSLVVGIDSMTVLMQDVGIASNFKPMPKDDLLARISAFTGKRRVEQPRSWWQFGAAAPARTA